MSFLFVINEVIDFASIDLFVAGKLSYVLKHIKFIQDWALCAQRL